MPCSDGGYSEILAVEQAVEDKKKYYVKKVRVLKERNNDLAKILCD